MQQSSQSLSGAWKRSPCALPCAVYGYLQRVADSLAGVVGCLLLLLVAPLVWLVNACFAPGPLFYWQQRVGLHGRRFMMVKFRSMIVGAERNGAVWTAQNDPRITPVGYLLRKSHLDELPQCWNLLKGDMSLIGPRPERPEFVDLLAPQLEGYHLRHRVKPGLTGWAQVNYGYGDSVVDARIKLLYDLDYIAQQSWRLDLLILLRTFSVLWQGR